MSFGGNGNSLVNNQDAVLGLASQVGAPVSGETVVNFDLTISISSAGSVYPSYFAALAAGPDEAAHMSQIGVLASGTGFVFGVKNGQFAYGDTASILNFSQTYAVRAEIHMVAGAANDFIRLFVGSSFDNLTLHADTGPTSIGFQDLSTVDSMLIRQRATANQFESGVTLYGMGVSTVPGPGALAVLGLAGLARRRRR